MPAHCALAASSTIVAGFAGGDEGGMKGRKDSSFFEKKEAKKLYPLAHMWPTGPQTDEVFLLLFVHKKKTLASSP